MGTGIFPRGGLVGLVLTLVGVGTISAALAIDLDYEGGWGARVFPLIAAATLLSLGLIELFTGLRRAAPDAEAAPTQRGAVLRVLTMLGLALGYTLAISRIGYIASTALVSPLAMLLFGVRRPSILLAALVLCPLVYHAVFFIGLGVFPPYAEWFDLANLLELF